MNLCDVDLVHGVCAYLAILDCQILLVLLTYVQSRPLATCAHNQPQVVHHVDKIGSRYYDTSCQYLILGVAHIRKYGNIV